MNKNKKSERLSVLSPLEEFAFYGLPDFDNEQRIIYFEFNDAEWQCISQFHSLQSKICCALQIGYFKAKHMFFNFAHKRIPREDLLYIMNHYFPKAPLRTFVTTKHDYYTQRKAISDLFGYKMWSNKFLSTLTDRAALSIKRDINPNFIAHELLDFLKNEKIVRPGYSTLQTVISQSLQQERYRLKTCLQNNLTYTHRQLLDQLLQNENTISELAALKQDTKSFAYKMMNIECKKHVILKPLYEIAKTILPSLDISSQNISHYASLVHLYSIYELDRFEAEQSYLYLLCYVFKRYQQVNDNLIEAFDFNVKKLEKEVKNKTQSVINDENEKVDKEIGRLMLLYVDDTLKDSMTLGEMRKLAFEILPKEVIKTLGEKW